MKKKIKGGGDCGNKELKYPEYSQDNLKFLGNNSSEFSEKFIELLLRILCIFDNRHDFKPGRSVLTPAEVKNTLNPYMEDIKKDLESSIAINSVSITEGEILHKLITIYKKCPMSKETEPLVIDVIYNDILQAAKLPDKIYSTDDASIFTNNTVIFPHEYDLIKACNYNVQIRYDNGKPYVHPSNTYGINRLLEQMKKKIAADVDISDTQLIKFCIDVSSIGKWVFQDNKSDNSHIIESIFDDYDHFKRKMNRTNINTEDIQLCDGNLQLKIFKVINTPVENTSDIRNDLKWYDKDDVTLKSKVMLSPEGDTAGVNKLSQAITALSRSRIDENTKDAYELIKQIFYNEITDEEKIKKKFAERCFDFKRIMDLGKLAFSLYKNRKFEKEKKEGNVSIENPYVVLVTHDRMLYALALCLRCPVIYVNIGSEQKHIESITPDLPSPGEKEVKPVLYVSSHYRKIEIRLPVKPNYENIYKELKEFINKIRETFYHYINISHKHEFKNVDIDIFKFYNEIQTLVPGIDTISDENNRKIRINIYLKKIINLLGRYINYSIDYISNILTHIDDIHDALEKILKKLEESEDDYKLNADILKNKYNDIKNKFGIKYNYIDKTQLDEEIHNVTTMINSYNMFISNLNEQFRSEITTNKIMYINEQPNIHNRVINEFKRTFNVKDYENTYHINLLNIFNEIIKNCDLRRNTLPKISSEPYLNNLNNMINIIVSQVGPFKEGGGNDKFVKAAGGGPPIPVTPQGSPQKPQGTPRGGPLVVVQTYNIPPPEPIVDPISETPAIEQEEGYPTMSPSQGDIPMSPSQGTPQGSPQKPKRSQGTPQKQQIQRGTPEKPPRAPKKPKRPTMSPSQGYIPMSESQGEEIVMSQEEQKQRDLEQMKKRKGKEAKEKKEGLISSLKSIKLKAVEDIYQTIPQRNYFNKYSYHLLDYLIEKELQRYKYITDDSIIYDEIIYDDENNNISYMMLYQVYIYFYKLKYYRNMLKDFEKEIEDNRIYIKAYEKEKAFIQLLRNKIKKYNNLYKYMVTKTKKICPFVDIPLMGGSKEKNHTIKNRYNFYNTFLKEFKKSLKL